MIIDSKVPPPVVAEPAEAPPAYDECGPPSPGFRSDQKRPSGSPATSARATPSTPRTPGAMIPSRVSTASGSNKTWFGLGSWYGEKETRKEVKQTIQSLIRDVIHQPSSPAAVSVMQSCLEACQARGLSFESIMSEKFIEGHSPLYWAIVKRQPTSAEAVDDQVNMLDIILSMPLNPTSRSEAYLACLTSSDQELFQRLRRISGVHTPSVSAADELLLGDAPGDELSVENQEGDNGEFRVYWKIAEFQKRVRALGGIGTEVVARSRIWSLAFTVLPRDAYLRDGTHLKAGSWVASVSLLAPSPATHLDAQFCILEPVTPQTPSHAPLASPSACTELPLRQPAADHTPSTQPPIQARRDQFSRWSGPFKNTQKPPITLRVQTNIQQLEPLPLHSTKQGLQEHVLNEPGLKTLIVPLSSHANGHSLQFDGCTYLNPDGSLSVNFDARLARPGTGDCVIC